MLLGQEYRTLNDEIEDKKRHVYVLKNAMEWDEEQSSVLKWQSETPSIGLTMVILSILAIHGGNMAEGVLYRPIIETPCLMAWLYFLY